MKRFFMIRDEHMPEHEPFHGEFHYIDLASHGTAGHKWNFGCVVDPHSQPHPEWIALPSLLDAATKLKDSPVPQEYLADFGLTGEETTLEAVTVLGAIHPMMGF